MDAQLPRKGGSPQRQMQRRDDRIVITRRLLADYPGIRPKEIAGVLDCSLSSAGTYVAAVRAEWRTRFAQSEVARR